MACRRLKIVISCIIYTEHLLIQNFISYIFSKINILLKKPIMYLFNIKMLINNEFNKMVAMSKLFSGKYVKIFIKIELSSK